MSCIGQLLKLKGDKEILPIHDELVIEGGGEYKGYEYIITFTSFGHRCGYVAIPEIKEDDEEPDFDCHGGVTFCSRQHAAKDLLPISCDDLWVGFDAAHYGDLRCKDTAKKYFPDCHEIENFATFDERYPGHAHRSYQYMEKECKSIVDQIIKQAGKLHD